MAQALFDDHPLEEYLRDVGENLLSIPGISSELEREWDPYFGMYDETEDDSLAELCPPILLNFLQSAMSSVKLHTPFSPFVERFKYNVISSSLLSSSLPTFHSARSSWDMAIPGKLNHHKDFSRSDVDFQISSSLSPHSSPSYGPIFLPATFFVAFLSIGYPYFAALSLFAFLFSLYSINFTTETPKHDMTSTFNALDDLIKANGEWESVVQDAVGFLDKEERIHLQSMSTTPSAIRLALHSCLQTTHTQADNIRQLFSALTSTKELSQLSEMYAPPSPTHSAFTLETNSRPLSVASHLPQPHTPTTPENKHSTWSGSNLSLARARSLSNATARRRDNHRTTLSDVFQVGTISAPATPALNEQFMPVPEENQSSSSNELPSNSDSSSPLSVHFGAAALDLRRRRKSGGLESLRNPISTDFRPLRHSMLSSSASPSKFTSVHPTRHLLSYSSLMHTLQGAFAAKRYTCSHLLALRFEEEDDEGYWEDVRSIIGLLASALTDGFSRLSEVLDDVEEQNLRDQNPTPDAGFEDQLEEIDMAQPSIGESRPRKLDSRVSFAPMPNHLSRFAAHIAAISSALDDARDNLEQCVSAIKSEPTSAHPPRLRHLRPLSKLLSPPLNNEEDESHIAVQAYERLRRELGLALRECERGRERLLEIINSNTDASDDEENEFDDEPGLAHDASDESDKTDLSPFCEDDSDANARAAVVYPEAGEGITMDDATTHLLLSASTNHLPFPGIEEVFEAEVGSKVVFSREKSKLSREERIKLAKVKRESGMGLGIASTEKGEDASPMSGIEKWGPGGEVVQELKDVIWKVSERRRKMTETAPSPSLDEPAS